MRFLQSLLESDEYKELMKLDAKKRCEWIVKQNSYILIRDEHWDKVFENIEAETDKEDFKYYIKDTIVNPLGNWTGGTDVDTGATNRKLGSDMGDSITGGGLHGKDLSKADVSINIYAWLKAQETGQPVEISCAIGDTLIDGKQYKEIVNIAKEYINKLGGFERFAEWGLIRPIEKE